MWFGKARWMDNIYIWKRRLCMMIRSDWLCINVLNEYPTVSRYIQIVIMWGTAHVWVEYEHITFIKR